MSEISLTASMRSNLLSLQNTQSLMDMTQERLSTGKKVNSAIDNPSSYYTAQSLNNRANDLSALLDSMGQAVQTIKAADEAITSITSFAEQAKAVASSALDSADAKEVESYMNQFNDIREQITQLAGDASYKGINLLNDDSLTVTFNESRTSHIVIEGVKADADSLKIGKASGWFTSEKAASVEAYDPEGTAEITQGTFVTATVDGKEGLYRATANIAPGADSKLGEFDASKFELITTDTTAVAAAKTVDGYTINDVTAATKEVINTSITAVEDAINELRSMSSTFGNNYSIVQNRQEFTENLINVLTEGADNLTLADMNEESANMLALQTRQQLAINSLSLASQASQAVLSLF